MSKPKVLISDKMDPNAARIFEERGCDVDVKPGMTSLGTETIREIHRFLLRGDRNKSCR